MKFQLNLTIWNHIEIRILREINLAIFHKLKKYKAVCNSDSFGPRQANLVFIAYASSEGSGEPAHPRSLARTFAARSYKQ